MTRMPLDSVRIALLFALACLCAAAQDRPIDLERSAITIHVGKAGLFSAAGHEHWVDAPIASGAINESTPRVAFTVETAKITVKPDPKVDEKTQLQIQKDMEEMTLDTRDFPRITFQSTRIEPAGGDWNVEGALTLHGVTRTVRLNVSKDGDAYVAHTTLRQTDYGIRPVTIGGGMVKVKDQIELDFRIVPRAF